MKNIEAITTELVNKALSNLSPDDLQYKPAYLVGAIDAHLESRAAIAPLLTDSRKSRELREYRNRLRQLA